MQYQYSGLGLERDQCYLPHTGGVHCFSEGRKSKRTNPSNTVRLPSMIAGVPRIWAKFPCRNAFVTIDYRVSLWGASTSFSRPLSCSAGSVARNVTAIPFVLQANVAKEPMAQHSPMNDEGLRDDRLLIISKSAGLTDEDGKTMAPPTHNSKCCNSS